MKIIILTRNRKNSLKSSILITALKADKESFSLKKDIYQHIFFFDFIFVKDECHIELTLISHKNHFNCSFANATSVYLLFLPEAKYMDRTQLDLFPEASYTFSKRFHVILKVDKIDAKWKPFLVLELAAKVTIAKMVLQCQFI